jgi:hypothetical protein
MKEYYQFFNLKIIMLNCNKAVTPFAMIIDKLPIRTPYNEPKNDTYKQYNVHS